MKYPVCAAIIMRDSATQIARCIVSAATYCQQIVVVDTGSEDDSPTIASRLGAEVHFFPWIGDFSAARNYAVERSRTKWILQLDADEELTTDDFVGGNVPFDDETIGGFTTEITNFLDDDTTSTHRYTRLFRNNPAIRYTGKIHEQIAPSILQAGLKIVNSDVKILHYGYIENNAVRVERNAAAIREELSNNPNDSWLLYHAGITEFSAKRYSQAEELLCKSLSANENSNGSLSDEQREFALMRLAQISLACDNPVKAKQWLDWTTTDENREGFRLYLTASALAMNREFSSALTMFQDSRLALSSLTPKRKTEEFCRALKTVLLR